LDWTWTIGQLFQQPENEKVTKAIEQLRQRISGKFDADTLINELQQMTLESKSEQFNHWDFSIPGAMTGGAIVTLLLLEIMPTIEGRNIPDADGSAGTLGDQSHGGTHKKTRSLPLILYNSSLC
jgi:hypothetical protein